MSMIFNFLRVTAAELDDYLNDSSLLEERIYNDEDEEGDPNQVDIDKAWAGIIFLLTGESFEHSTHPLLKAFFSGQEIDQEQDLGYGPGQYLTPDQVKEMNGQISEITIDELSSKYDPKKLSEAEVYPNVWEKDDMLSYLTEYFETVQEVYAEAAAKDEAIITFLN